jgi:hypothetical protein
MAVDGPGVTAVEGAMDVVEMLAEVARKSGAEEARAVHVFDVVRPRSAGMSPRTLRVEVHDAGPDAGALRFSIVTFDAPDVDSSPSYRVSNPEATLDLALSVVHWREYDH